MAESDIVGVSFDLTGDQVKLLPELWGMVFRKLDSHALRKNLGLVCKEWLDIIQNDPLFSSELKIKKANKTEKLELTTENVNSILGSFPVLKKLEFYECENLILKDLDFNQCPNLEKVIYHISEFDSHLNCTVFKGSECALFPFLHTVHEISFHPKEDLEALNIANIHSLEILSVTQPRQTFNSKQLDKFDFKTFGINLRNNLETVTIHIREEDLDDIQPVDFHHSQLLANTPKLKTIVMCFSQELAKLQDGYDGAFDRYISYFSDATILPIETLQSCSHITKFEFKPLNGYIIDPFNNCDVIDIILKYLKDSNELVIWNCDWNASSIGVDSWCLTETSCTQNTLKKLALKQCALDTKDIVNFEEIVRTFTNLEELQVEHFAGRKFCFQTENLEEDLVTLSLLRNLRIIKFTGLYEMGNSRSRRNNGKDDDEDGDDNEIFVRQLKMAQRTL